MVVLLVSIALAMSLTLGATGAPQTSPFDSTPKSMLPATVPGLSRQEGVFLITAADDGSRAVYFIAQNSRHSIAMGDLQLEQQLNSLWPVQFATRDEVLAFPESSPVGSARVGLIQDQVALEASAPDEAAAEAPSPVADEPSPVAEVEPVPVAEVVPVLVALAPHPTSDAPSRVKDVAPSRVAAVMPAPVADEPSPVADEPSPVADEPSPADAATPEVDQLRPVANAPSASPMPHAPVAIPSTAMPADLNLAPPTAQRSLDIMPTASEPITYVVQSGDNLIHLSARFGTTVQAILAVNGIPNPNRVYVGQSLVIPAKPDVVEAPAAPAPVATDFQEPVADAPASEVASTYTVKRGDSAITIAKQLNVNVDELLKINAVYNRNRVYVGQVLTIPGG